MHSIHSTTNGSGGTTIVTLGRGTTVTSDTNERTVSTVTVTPSELNQSGIVTIAGGGGNNINMQQAGAALVAMGVLYYVYQNVRI